MVPLLELVLLLRVSQWIGVLPTIGLVVATGVVGAALARRQGLRAWLGVQEELAAARVPARSLLDGLSVLVGGAFLLTPGILTDIAGFSLLVPVSRRWIQAALRRRMERSIREGALNLHVVTSAPGPGQGRVEVGAHPPGSEDSR